MQTLQEHTNKTESKEYYIVRLQKGNLKDVAWLHSEVYNVAPAIDFFIKKYDTAYTGISDVGFIAYNRQDQPVAYYGVIPCLVQWRDDIMLAAQSADTMTHPKHRYKGMFVELSNMTFDLCKELGIKLVFGFPNKNSLHGAINKLGWKMTEEMVCFTIPVKRFLIPYTFRRIKFFSKWYERYKHAVVRKWLVPQQGVSNSAIEEGFGGVQRSGRYCNYKTYSPSYVLKTGGCTLWFSKKNDSLIGDMEGADEKNFEMVMTQLTTIASRLGIKAMQFHCSPGTRLFSLFEKKYEQTPSYPALFQDFGSPIPPEKIKFTFADIDIF